MKTLQQETAKVRVEDKHKRHKDNKKAKSCRPSSPSGEAHAQPSYAFLRLPPFPFGGMRAIRRAWCRCPPGLTPLDWMRTAVSSCLIPQRFPMKRRRGLVVAECSPFILCYVCIRALRVCLETPVIFETHFDLVIAALLVRFIVSQQAQLRLPRTVLPVKRCTMSIRAPSEPQDGQISMTRAKTVIVQESRDVSVANNCALRGRLFPAFRAVRLNGLF